MTHGRHRLFDAKRHSKPYVGMSGPYLVRYRHWISVMGGTVSGCALEHLEPWHGKAKGCNG